MATYEQLVDMVLDWSNRDKEVLSRANILTFMDFAADNIYRQLRIPPLEYVRTSVIGNVGDSENRLTIPSDAIEFIQLRRKDSNSLTGWEVYADKPDIRSFYQDYIWKDDYPYYTREGNSLLVCPNLKQGDNFELYYYRRLPAPWARYAVDTDSTGAFVDSDAANITRALEYAPGIDVATRRDGVRVMGTEVPNWLRDENEKLLLFGTLAEAFTYLDDAEMAQKYGARFAAELQQLMDEENKRMYRGGNIQVHYSAPLI